MAWIKAAKKDIAVPFSYSPLSSSVHPRVPYGSPGPLCLRGGAVFLLVSAGQLPWLGLRAAGLAVFCAVPSLAAPVVCASVLRCGCRKKDVLDLCPNDFDEILQVLRLKSQTKAAGRARTGYGSNQ